MCIINRYACVSVMQLVHNPRHVSCLYYNTLDVQFDRFQCKHNNYIIINNFSLLYILVVLVLYLVFIISNISNNCIQLVVN